MAVTGCTGGLGRELCFKLVSLGANLIMLDRNKEKSQSLENELLGEFKNANIKRIQIELENIDEVKTVTEKLINLKPDIFIANAGAYSIPRYRTSTGYDNVFQINFISPYYMACRIKEVIKSIKIVAVGSIAHTYSVIDQKDIDFSTRKNSALAYGNSKRFLMLSLAEKFKNDPQSLAIVHPGITFTNLTAHYPKLIFAVIKHPMKIIFMKPKKAVLCILEGVFEATPYGFWIGPKFFSVWGKPKMQRLKAVFTEDGRTAIINAEEIYNQIKEK